MYLLKTSHLGWYHTHSLSIKYSKQHLISITEIFRQSTYDLFSPELSSIGILKDGEKILNAVLLQFFEAIKNTPVVFHSCIQTRQPLQQLTANNTHAVVLTARLLTVVSSQVLIVQGSIMAHVTGTHQHMVKERCTCIWEAVQPKINSLQVLSILKT